MVPPLRDRSAKTTGHRAGSRSGPGAADLADRDAGTRRAIDARRALAPILRALGPPVLAFFLARFALWLAAVATGQAYFRGATWTRWDSGLYMDIAAHGYSLVPCGAGYPPGSWCGNAGWFPAYPGLMAVLDRTGMPLPTAGIVISALFALGTLIVLWMGLLDRTPSRQNYLALGFAAFLPGMVYHHAVFPLSMAAFFLVLALALLRRGRWLLAGAAGAVGAMAYPTFVVVAPVVAAWVLWRGRGRAWPARVGEAAAASLPIVGGFLCVLLIQRIETGAWDAYFKVQDKYDHALVNPVSAWIDAVRPAFEGVKGIETMPAVQAAVVGCLILITTGWMIAVRRSLDALDWLALAATLALWLFPLSQDEVHLYRPDALLVPLALLVRRLPGALQVASVACVALLAAPVAEAFFRGLLV